jgi:AcrR family transcriptional regulator
LQARRKRLIDAFTKVAAERGYGETTIADIVTEAGVPRSAFYAHFSNKRQCLSAAHDEFFGRLLWEAASAVDDGLDWPMRVRAAVGAVLEFVDETASRSRFFAIEVLAAGPLALERHTATIERVVPMLREGREHFPAAADLPELTEPMLIGGAAYLLCNTLLVEERLRVSLLATELVEMLLAPYMGRGEARRIAT